MDLHKCILTNNDCYKSGRTIVPKGIMVHSTGANNPNLRRYVGPDDGILGQNGCGNDWNRSGVGACVHAFIGKTAGGSIATYQTLPWNYRAWHCGSHANNTHISFEICEDSLNDRGYFDAVYKEAAELCAYLCKMYGLTENDIICHSEGAKMGIASNHGDVMHWFPRHGKSMDTFRADVAALIKKDDPDNGSKQDAHGWYYLENGSRVKNRWEKDSGGWCYIGKDGYMVKNQWAKDSKHWYYMGPDGHFTRNKWVKDSKDWCYVDSDGWMTTNAWEKDNHGWCYLKADGHILRDGWASDSSGKHYIGADGYKV